MHATTTRRPSLLLSRLDVERIEELLAEIECALGQDVTVLVKGSRFMQMERVVKSFVEKADSPQASLPPGGADCPPRGGPSEGKQCS